ncbi:MAG: hypothetical protein WAU39_17335 [Polyangiales bacterium]
MNHSATYLARTFFVTTCLVFGCSGGGTLGCGSSSSSTPEVDSNLIGTYQVNSYEGSQTDCTQPEPISPSPSYLVLYSFVTNDKPDEPHLGAAFCSSPAQCADVAKEAPVPGFNAYAFTSGDDASGWTGFGISRAGPVADQCSADVQTHTMTSPSSGVISIETRTQEVVFPPDMVAGDTVTCKNSDALAALTPDLPCMAIILVDATLDTSN